MVPNESVMERRRFLQVGAATLATAVAGCGLGTGAETPSDDDRSPTTTPRDTATPEPTASPTPEPTPTPTETPTETPTPTATVPPQAAQVVAVADGKRTFDPQVFEIEAGETVAWVWHSSGHNVRATARPRGSDFTGTAGGDKDFYDEGHTFSHTFDVAGEYEYYCYPHRNVGMTGSFTVVE
ncbi:plastocyanin/azurin family copper-binding protein [Halosimplex aquaticum]|uniref:Plastocyanin/azurin family copper-binding protein n=1 Tax=Halosimplex aquaticum TaxID=3026162 RepID=A0ABD5XZ93_9EURY|nr:plastocyanin/azurin family copper-binding protein [Halosimplex aquaticum]